MKLIMFNCSKNIGPLSKYEHGLKDHGSEYTCVIETPNPGPI